MASKESGAPGGARKQPEPKQPKRPAREPASGGSELAKRFKANPFLFIGTIFILVIVIIAFVLVPAIVPEAGGGAGDLTFGSYNKTPITYVQGSYFYQVQQSLAQQYQSSMSEGNYQFLLYQLWREAFELAVVHAAMLDTMKTAGYTAPEDVVDREVALRPEFQENGYFSVSRYRAMDAARRIALWRQVQDSIAVERYYNDVTGLAVSSREAAFVSGMAAPQRSFDLVAFPLSSYPDDEIAAYVRSTPGTFTVAHLSRITLNSSEREARQVLASIQDGSRSFEDAAQASSQDAYADAGGDMGIRMAYELEREIPDETARAAALALANGEYSDVMKISTEPASWAFFRAEEAPRPADPADAATIDKIRTYLMTYERGRVEDWVIARANRFAADVRAVGFDAARGEVTTNDDGDTGDIIIEESTTGGETLPKKTFGPVPINYGGAALFPSVSSSGLSELSAAQTNDTFWRAAFSTPLQTPSDPLVLGDNVLVLYPTDETGRDEEYAGFVEAYYSSWVSSAAESGVRAAFLNSPKLDDRFWDVFNRILQ